MVDALARWSSCCYAEEVGKYIVCERLVFRRHYGKNGVL
jgi:hypothetical protein